METVRINRGLMVVLAGNHIYTSHSIGYRETPKIEMDNIGRLIKDGIVVFDELEENSRLKTVMRKFEALIAIPLKTDKDKQGLLLLGEKLSGDMYSQKDIAAFEVIGPEIAVALTNAQAYERIEKFNTTLRTEINKATADLQRKNEQLRELDKAKDEFISMASHQLRTPLTAIKGYLSMLLEGDAGEIKVSQYDFVNEAFQGANRMVGLINDLLNVSRMETGRFFLEPVEVDLDKVVQEEVKQLYNHAKEKHLYIRYEKKGEVPKVMADETKIRQVIMNFIDNAVYYTNTGGVTVHLRKDKQDVVFEVHDTGIGVPKSAQKSLFSKFYRADNARHVRPDGTGLGIYLAKRVMDDHNGEIIFKSTEGKGSVFGFRLAIKSKFSDKSVTPPAISAPATAPSLGELAAGVGVSAEAVRECQVTPPPACDPPKVVSPTEGADKATQLLKEAEEHRN
jgi:signal transduction histidine kinase